MQTEYVDKEIKNNSIWLFKIIAKIILSRVPLIYQFWQKIGIFRHGRMDNAEYAVKTFFLHFKNCYPNKNVHGKTFLELGPGDSIASAMIARSLNCKCILVDTGNYLTKSTSSYIVLKNKLIKIGLNPPDLNNTKNVEDILSICKAEYYTEGLKSLRNIPDNSVDMVFSQAVLEHIKLDIFEETVYQLRRILKKDGLTSHEIDLKDHLSYSLNNLRFSKNLWESKFISNSGFYTNRLRYSEIIDIFKKNNFKTKILRKKLWKKLPLETKKFNKIFHKFDKDEMLISEFNILTTNK